MTPALIELLRRADGQLRAGASAEARNVLEEAAARDHQFTSAPEFWALLAQAHLQDDAPQDALHAIDRALAARPRWPEALHLRARALRDLRRLDDARASIDAAIGERADEAGALATLGTIEHLQGNLAGALSALERSLTLTPSDQRAWRAYAEVLEASGREAAALSAWRRWVELRNGSASSLARYGSALAAAHRWDEAEAELVRASRLPDAKPSMHLRLSHVRSERGDVDGALSALQAACVGMPNALTPRFGHALLLPQVYRSVDDVTAWRDRYQSGLEKLAAELPAFVSSPAELWRLDWSNFYLAYQGEDDVDLQRRYAKLMATLAKVAAPEWTQPSRRICLDKPRLRVGFASSFFRTCTVGSYFSSWPLGLDRQRFEVCLFHFGKEVDATTTRLRSSVEHFAHIGPSVKEIATAIHRAEVDVLVYPQIGMDGRDATLAALRLAPVQCAAWGHPVTTGSHCIDYFFSCDAMEPEDASLHYTERLLRLPGLGTRYRLPETPQASRRQFGLPESGHLYACPHSVFKIHPEFDPVLADVLAADPTGRLVCCVDRRLPSGERFAERVRTGLADRNIDPKRLLLQPLRAPDEFRALLSVCDVMIDTSRWSGGNTALDALAACLPIVVAPGKLMRGRQSAAMLKLIGMDDLVVERQSAVASRAVAVAADSAKLRMRIMKNRGVLFDRSEPIMALADGLVAVSGSDVTR